MTTTTKVIFFFLVLAISLTTALTVNQQYHHDLQKRHNNHVANIVHITNSLPKSNSSPALRVRCSSQKTDLGFKTIASGDDYQWKVDEKALYYCEALWGRFMASWHAFQPKRDAGHRSVFWLVKQKGFFLSWDNSTWVKKSVWETE